MAYLMGIDLGTTSVKVEILSVDGNVMAISAEEYMFYVPYPGYAEQPPDEWWEAVKRSILKAIKIANITPDEILCIGLSGQMHGTVMLDRQGKPVYNAILHCDVRSQKQADQIVHTFQTEFQDITYNRPFPGMQLLSLMWMRENQNDVYRNIYMVMSPKDYVRFRLTSEFGTEATDASATLAYDMEKQTWSDRIIEQVGLERRVFADYIGKAEEIAGSVTKEAALETGLQAGTPVVYGGADIAMQMLGNGIFKKGEMAVIIGTSGQVVAISDRPVKNSKFNTHTFRHPKGNTWYGMGAILTGGVALNWYRQAFMPTESFVQLSKLASSVRACSEGLIFFPCMLGERTPYMDPNLRGAFIGVSMIHGKAHFVRAIMEGVAFALKSGMEELQCQYGSAAILIAAGGGARSSVWLQILADIFNMDIYTTKTKEQGCTGAAMVAGIGYGIYRNFEEACNVLVKLNETITHPNPLNVQCYTSLYEDVYTKIFQMNKELMHTLCKN